MSAKPDTDAAFGRVVRCPRCGNDGADGVVYYLVDTVLEAEVCALGRAATLELAGPPALTTSRPSGRPRLECRAVCSDRDGRVCGAQWELPAEVRGVAWRVPS